MRGRRLLTLPNLISAARVPMAIAFLAIDHRITRLVLIVAAGLTDFADGWLARRGRGSRFGAVLDPVTDKAFLVTALISLAVSGAISMPELLVLLARDGAVAFGFAVVVLLHAPMHLSARLPGKTVTVLQLAALVVLVLFPAWHVPVVTVVGAASAVAICDYGRLAVIALRTLRIAH
ncbi:MAG: CDP-alcohol phosphatidyltransferase family protein [Gemmatimonadetes bacterium]|nr:CDP-alcohol phosphatidyltransferase family protein [Gemmatimonadota bacterium]